jgi:hypothetical protein
LRGSLSPALFLLARTPASRACRSSIPIILFPLGPPKPRLRLWLGTFCQVDPRLAAALKITPNPLKRLTTGNQDRQPFRAEFPIAVHPNRLRMAERVVEPARWSQPEDTVNCASYHDELLTRWKIAGRLTPKDR